jgi:phosphoglycerol transferase MdoB-like AlkP superfamily enzyme
MIEQVQRLFYGSISGRESGEAAALSQTSPRRLAFAVSLFVVCIAAKLPVLIGRDLSLTWWLVPALFWQDILLCLVAAPVFFAVRRQRWIAWLVYALTVMYLAVNAVLMLILSSPLTVAMARATGDALLDSIVIYLTPANLATIGTLIFVGLAAPFFIPPMQTRSKACLTAIAVFCVLIGPHVTARTETQGLHRNAVVAFARSLFPRVIARPGTLNWRASPIHDQLSSLDLSALRGVAANRNLVLVSLESTGAQYLAPWGASKDPMPNLTRLAASGILFENAYAVYPESIKGLLSTLCSMYPAIDTSVESQTRAAPPSVAAVMASTGCTNALFHSGRFMYLGMDEVVKNRGFHHVVDAGGISGNFNSSFGVDEPATVEKMLAWLDSLPNSQRFFLSYLPIAGHHPYDTPEAGPFSTASERDRYLNALWYGDKALGRFLQELTARGLDTNTVFVIYGDHAEAFGQHVGNYGHTLNIYEENVRVPLLIVAPGLINEPIRVPRTASLIDLAPTVLDLFGLKTPPDYQGTSLFQPAERMALFFTDYSLGLLGLRDCNWKLIFEVESGHSQLFDLQNDAAEQRNIASDRPEDIAEWRRHLLDWAAAQRFRQKHPSTS